MTLIKKRANFATVGLVALTLVGCGGDDGSPEGAVSIYPAAIEELMNGPYLQAIKDVGLATHSDKIAALRKARMDADVKIARQFEQEVASLRNSYIEMVNDGLLEDQREVNETFTLIQLRGSSVVKEMVEENDGIWTAYVLKVVSAEQLQRLADEQADALTEFKATQAYQDLEERVAAEHAARAAGLR